MPVSKSCMIQFKGRSQTSCSFFKTLTKAEIRCWIEGNQNPENFVSVPLKKITEVLVNPALKKTTSQLFAHLFSSSPRFQSVLIFSILLHPCTLLVYSLSLWFFFLSQKLLLSGFLLFIGNFVRVQNNDSTCLDLAP